jgi:hypothetical protein
VGETKGARARDGFAVDMEVSSIEEVRGGRDVTRVPGDGVTVRWKSRSKGKCRGKVKNYTC